MWGMRRRGVSFEHCTSLPLDWSFPSFSFFFSSFFLIGRNSSTHQPNETINDDATTTTTTTKEKSKRRQRQQSQSVLIPFGGGPFFLRLVTVRHPPILLRSYRFLFCCLLLPHRTEQHSTAHADARAHHVVARLDSTRDSNRAASVESNQYSSVYYEQSCVHFSSPLFVFL